MICSNCKAELVVDAKFCGACGSPVPQAEAPQGNEPEIDFSTLQTIDDSQTRPPTQSDQKRMQPGEVFAGRYTITRLIGEGGMGVVYHAIDKITEVDVALKLIRADRLAGTDAVKRLIREGVTSRDIRHPNVIAVYDVGEADGQPFMSMEFVKGRSLRAFNREQMQGAECSMKTAANIIREILSGLEAAHAAGVIHRDLKPENVMLLSQPSDAGVKLKLLDFGIARAPNSGDTGATSLGTRGYMAPEQLTAPDAAQPSADLFSLSVMFYELLVGVVPQNYWQPPSGGRADVPEAIDQLIQKGLSASPRARFQSVAEYREALEAALKKQTNGGTGGGGMWSDRPEVQDAIKKTAELFNKGGLIGALAEKTRTDTAGRRSPTQDTAITSLQRRSLWQWFFYDVTKAYAQGNGRAHRKEYWGFNLYALVFFFVAGVLDGSGVLNDDFGSGYGETVYMATAICWLLLVAPSVALASRRMHDLGYSGWLAAAVAIPGIGSVVAILMGLPKGAAGPNAYGPDPLAVSGEAG
jgi:serine/threonine protein kinase/uncharacterized membrane protein YhaH (DUF805 family)